MNESKECIEPPEDKSAWFRFRMWWYENNPIPHRIQYWWQDQDCLHPIRCWYKFLRLLDWCEVLWNDVDFDHSGIWHILYFKLKLMHEEQSSNSHHVDSEKTCAEMAVARDCAYRLWKDQYLEKERLEHRNKWPSMFERKSEWIHLSDGTIQMPSPSDEERDSIRKLMTEEEARKQADMDQLSKSLSTQITGWWD